MSEIFFNKMVTKGLEPIESDGRFFEGYLTVQVKDKQGEVTIVDELYKVLPIWMDRGAPITDTHSNRVIGKGINFARAEYTDADGTIYPAIKVTGKIYKDYELDNEIWSKIKSGEYKGLSFGGSTKTDREPMRMKDGSIAYSLSKLEHYEVAVCKDPAVPLAVITDINPIAKANMNCDHTGCYVTKPILGEPNFESATRKVMEESNVPEKNAKRIVGAAEHGKLRKGAIAIGNGEKCPFCDDIQGKHFDDTTEHLLGKHQKEFMAALSGDKNIGMGDSKEKAIICKQCGLPKICKDCQLSHEGSCIDAWKKGKKKKVKKGKQVKERKKRKKQSQGIGNKRGWNAYKATFAPKDGKLNTFNTFLDGLSGEQLIRVNEYLKRKVKEQNKKYGKEGASPKQQEDITSGMEGMFKALIDTNKILNLYQGNILPLARLLDKDAPADIKRPSGNVPAKRKEPKGQSHGAQSTRERERGIKEQQDSPDYHYTKPQSLDPKRVTVPNEEFGEGFGDTYPFSTLDDKLDYQRARRPYESLIGTNATLADPRKRKSLFVTIYNKLKGKKRGAKLSPSERFHFHLPSTSGKKKDPKPKKGRKGGSEISNRRAMETMSPEVRANYERNMKEIADAKPSGQFKIHDQPRPKKGKKKIKKVGSGAMIDPNQANQGAGFAIRNQTPPRRKKTRTMEAKLGDGTYDYSN